MLIIKRRLRLLALKGLLASLLSFTVSQTTFAEILSNVVDERGQAAFS